MEAKSFFGSLFDYSFSSFITPRIIKVLYVLATIVDLAVDALPRSSRPSTCPTAPEAGMLLIGGPLFFLVSMLYARVLLELVIAFFRINGNVQEIRDERIGGAPQPHSEPRAAPEDAPVVAPAESLPDDRGCSGRHAPSSREPEYRDPRRRADRRARGRSRRSTRYCENCGAERRPEGRFCTSCGQA